MQKHKYKLQAENEQWKEGNQLDDLIVDYFQSMFPTTRREEPTEFLEPSRVQGDYHYE